MSGHAPWHSLTAEDSNCISLNCSFTRFTQTTSHIHQPSDCPHSSTALHSTPCPGTFPTAQAGRNITPSHPNAHSNFFLFSEKKDLEGQRQMPDHETIPAASEAEAPPCTHTQHRLHLEMLKPVPSLLLPLSTTGAGNILPGVVMRPWPQTAGHP